jgi:N-acyl-D-aspartate/D-glutamate deacylase
MNHGSVVVRDGAWTGSPGHGRFARREPAGHAPMA